MQMAQHPHRGAKEQARDQAGPDPAGPYRGDMKRNPGTEIPSVTPALDRPTKVSVFLGQFGVHSGILACFL